MKRDKKIKKIKLIICDVEGVLTNGGTFYTENGNEMIKFNTRDGMAIELLKKINIPVILLSSNISKIIKKRGKKLVVDYMILEKNKIKDLNKVCQKFHVNNDEVCYIGDDQDDELFMTKVGFCACPNNTVSTIKEKVDFVCKNNSGEGVLREVAELIMKLNGRKND